MFKTGPLAHRWGVPLGSGEGPQAPPEVGIYTGLNAKSDIFFDAVSHQYWTCGVESTINDWFEVKSSNPYFNYQQSPSDLTVEVSGNAYRSFIPGSAGVADGLSVRPEQKLRLYSDVANGNWKVNGNMAKIIDGTLGPDNATNAVLLKPQQPNPAGAICYYPGGGAQPEITTGTVAGAKWRGSFLVKNTNSPSTKISLVNFAVGQRMSVTIDWTAPFGPTISTTGQIPTSRIEDFGGGWYRIIFYHLTETHNGGVSGQGSYGYWRIEPDTTGGDSGIYVWHPNLSSSSYLNVEGNWVAQPSRQNTWNGLPFQYGHLFEKDSTCWYNSTKGTFYIECRSDDVTPGQQGGPTMMTFYASTSNYLSLQYGRMEDSYRVKLHHLYTSTTTGYTQLLAGTPRTVNDWQTHDKIAIRYGDGVFGISINGEPTVSGPLNSNSMFLSNTMVLRPGRWFYGQQSVTQPPLNGCVRQMGYWGGSMASDLELETLSTVGIFP